MIPPVTVGAAQEYKVPEGTIPLIPSVGEILNEAPLQPVPVIALITATGLTVTTSVNDAPAQMPEVGVTVYVAVLTELVVLIRLSKILSDPVLFDKPPEIPVPVGAVQV